MYLEYIYIYIYLKLIYWVYGDPTYRRTQVLTGHRSFERYLFLIGWGKHLGIITTRTAMRKRRNVW